jgi:hypothetical protein
MILVLYLTISYMVQVPHISPQLMSQFVISFHFDRHKMYNPLQWRKEGDLGGFNPPPRNSEVLESRTGLQIEQKIFSVPIPTPQLIKFAEFWMPAPKDVRKKGNKILKLPRFAIVLHFQ